MYTNMVILTIHKLPSLAILWVSESPSDESRFFKAHGGSSRASVLASPGTVAPPPSVRGPGPGTGGISRGLWILGAFSVGFLWISGFLMLLDSLLFLLQSLDVFPLLCLFYLYFFVLCSHAFPLLYFFLLLCFFASFLYCMFYFYVFFALFFPVCIWHETLEKS